MESQAGAPSLWSPQVMLVIWAGCWLFQLNALEGANTAAPPFLDPGDSVGAAAAPRAWIGDVMMMVL
eukprot:6834841-Pyramimonas_sp.AAC.1